MGFSTVVGIVREVCEAIWECLVDDYMPPPTDEDWRAIAKEYQELWKFPNCLGAIDGKHVTIRAPSCSGSLYHNYKGNFSVVLLAVVDARYRFRMIDVGAYGKSSDGGVLAASHFGQALRQATLNIPEDVSLPGAEHLGPMPHVFVGDEAFPLRKNMMRPFPGRHLTRERRIFNYRLSSARRMVECAFGIMASQFRLYHRVLGVAPETADVVVKATCILHNYMRWNSMDEDVPSNPSNAPLCPTEGAVQNILRVSSNNATNEAMAMREKFTTYFSSPAGAVPWQDRVV